MKRREMMMNAGGGVGGGGSGSGSAAAPSERHQLVRRQTGDAADGDVEEGNVAASGTLRRGGRGAVGSVPPPPSLDELAGNGGFGGGRWTTTPLALTYVQRWRCALLILLLGSLAVTHRILTLRRSSTLLRGGKTLSEIRLSSLPPSETELKALNSYFDGGRAGSTSRMNQVDDVLMWSHEHLGGNLIQLTSFGPSGLVLLDRLHHLGLLSTIPVVTVDTLHLFPETYEFVSTLQTASQYSPEMDLRSYRPKDFGEEGDTTRQKFDERYGANLWKSDPDRYAYLSKVEPTLRAVGETRASAYITGRRRSQGGERVRLNVFEIAHQTTADDDEAGAKRGDDDTAPWCCLAINPLINWSYDEVWDYIRTNNVPYNPLHDRGYKSIGDTMTTIAVADGADERSGRFVGQNRTECGIHSVLARVKRIREEAAAAAAKTEGEEGGDGSGGGGGVVVEEEPTLPCEDCLDLEDADAFEKVVLKGETDVLLEFYSPWCGGCQEFSPKYVKIAKLLKPLGSKIVVSRFDITDMDIPDAGKDAGFQVDVTPTLYLVRRDPLRLAHYDGDHDVGSVLDWLKRKTSYVDAADLKKKAS